MRKLLIILPFLLASCVTQKACLEKFPPETIIEYKDTIIPYYVSSTDTIEKWGTITDTLIVNSGSAHGRTWVIHDTLRLQVWQTDSTYMIRLDSAIQVIKIRDQVIKEVSKKSAWTEIKFSLLIILCIFVIGLAIKLVK